MPRNGSGTMSRTDGTYTGSTVWQQNKNAGVKINSLRFDTHDQDIADAITASIAKDGQTTPTANLPMGGFIHTGVGNASARTNYASAADVQDGTSISGVTTGSSNAYIFTPSPALPGYVSGQQFRLRANFTNTGACTLAVSGLAAKAIVSINNKALATNGIVSSYWFTVIYDATLDKFVLSECSPVLQSWGPTYGCSGSMTFTSVNTLFADYIYNAAEDKVHIELEAVGILGSSGGTGSNVINFTVPIGTAKNMVQLSARIYDNTEAIGFCEYYAGVMNVKKADITNFNLGTPKYIFVSGEYIRTI